MLRFCDYRFCDKLINIPSETQRRNCILRRLIDKFSSCAKNSLSSNALLSPLVTPLPGLHTSETRYRPVGKRFLLQKLKWISPQIVWAELSPWLYRDIHVAGYDIFRYSGCPRPDGCDTTEIPRYVYLGCRGPLYIKIRDKTRPVGATRRSPLHPCVSTNKPRPEPQSIGSIMAGFKSAITK